MWATPDAKFSQAMCRVYNDWAWEVFGPYNDRLAPMACIATGDIEGAIAEIQRCAKLGFKGLSLPCKPVWGAPNHEDLNYNLPEFDPLWAAIQDVDLPITFHVSTGRDPRTARGNGGAVINYAVHSLAPTMEPIVNICASGVLERFPKLRFGSIEAGIGWVPWALTAMDEAYRKHHMWVRPKLQALPSEYFNGARVRELRRRHAGARPRPRRTVSSTTSCGRTTTRTTKARGRTRPQAIERTMGDLDDDERAKILGLNAARDLQVRRCPTRYLQFTPTPPPLRPRRRVMDDRTLRGKVAVVGVGETPYYKRGQSPDPEFKLAMQAIVTACAERRHFAEGRRRLLVLQQRPQRRVAPRRRARHSRICASRACSGAAAAAAAPARSPTRAAAIATGQAECVVVFRALAQGQFGRFGQGCAGNAMSGEFAHTIPYGLMSPAQMFAMKVQRFMHDHGVEQSALRAISLASYAHAQNNPRAVMYGRPLDAAKYDASRWIVEPFHLFDCCQENDGAAAMVLVSAERAKDFDHPPCYLLSAVAGSHYRAGGAGAQHAGLRDVRRSRRWRRVCSRWRKVGPDRRRRAAELRELHRRRADEHRRARLLRRPTR